MSITTDAIPYGPSGLCSDGDLCLLPAGSQAPYAEPYAEPFTDGFPDVPALRAERPFAQDEPERAIGTDRVTARVAAILNATTSVMPRTGLARVCLVAGPEAIPAAEGAAAAMRSDGHVVDVVPVDDLRPLATADAVLVLGGAGLEAAARAVAPAHAQVVAELLEGSAAGWQELVLRAARLLAGTAELTRAPAAFAQDPASIAEETLELCG